MRSKPNSPRPRYALIGVIGGLLVVAGCQSPTPVVAPGPGPAPARAADSLWLQALPDGSGAVHGRAGSWAGITVSVGSLQTTTGAGASYDFPALEPGAGPAVSVEDSAPRPPQASVFRVTHEPLRFGLLAAGDALSPLAASDEFKDPANADRTVMVMHDFGDARGEVLTERRVRKHPLGNGQRDRYVYLRGGEFLLEDVPPGAAKLEASLCGTSSASVTVQVAPGFITRNVRLDLDVTEPLFGESGSRIKVLTASNPTPAMGLGFTVSAGGSADARLVFAQSPATMSTVLQAPGGSGGATIKAIDVIYVSQSPAAAALGQPPRQIGPFRVPISPLTVPPGSDLCPGAGLPLTVTVDAGPLAALFTGADRQAWPGLIVANVELIDESDHPVLDANFQNIQLTFPLRRL